MKEVVNKRAKLAYEVYQTIVNNTESLVPDNIGATLAFLMAAILESSSMALYTDAPAHVAFAELCDKCFWGSHPVWRHITLDIPEPSQPPVKDSVQDKEKLSKYDKIIAINYDGNVRKYLGSVGIGTQHGLQVKMQATPATGYGVQICAIHRLGHPANAYLEIPLSALREVIAALQQCDSSLRAQVNACAGLAAGKRKIAKKGP